MRNISILVILAAWALCAQAIEVSSNAGSLADNVSDLSVAELTVTGTMNAEDFYFISDNLHQLTTLDIQNVIIEPCRTAQFHYWKNIFPANEVPIGAFGGMDLTNVVLPASALVIQEAAFAGCSSLETIQLPAALDSIGSYAFAGCTSLTTVTLPASVTVVGDGAFMRCTSLESISVEPSGRLRTIGEAALMDCPLLTNVNLGEALLSTGERLMAGSGVTNLDLTASKRLTALGDWMMVQTPVATATLPAGMTSVGNGSFLYATGLTSLTMGETLNELGDFAMAGSGLTGNIAFTGLERLGDYALYNVTGLVQVELPESMVWLGDSAMAGMKGLETLTCLAAEVPALGVNVWAGVNQRKVPLTVPESSKDLYQEAEQWKEFFFGEDWLRGDVNGDGEVNIADINALLDIILGGKVDDATRRRADVNEDGEVGIADVNAVMDIILSPGSHAPATIDCDDLLHLDDLAIMPGEQRTITVKLDNAGTYSALQCDVTLPQGLTLVGGVTANAQGHTSESRAIDDVTTRTLVYSMSKNCFESEDDAVITFIVSADAALAAEAQITLSNIVLSGDDNTAHYAPDCIARVMNSTGVEDLMAAADRVWVEGRSLCIDSRNNGEARLVAVNGVSRSVNLDKGVNRYLMEPGFYVVIVNGKSYKIVIK